MKPNRPGSAKSTHTRLTVDSELSSNPLSGSKFSETYSNGVNANCQKKKDFHEYVKQKNKDPRFKKLVESKMPEIPQKIDTSLELSKLTSKPFEKKNSKMEKRGPQKKVEEPASCKKGANGMEKSSGPQKGNAKTFMDKSKKKMRLGNKKQGEGAEDIKQQGSTSGAAGAGNNRINFTGFTVKIPGKPVQVISEESPVKGERIAEEEEEERKRLERQEVFSELSNFVDEVESRNSENFPRNYDAFIEDNLSRIHSDMDVDIEKINIENFLAVPNERDYQQLMKKIDECDQRIEGGRAPSTHRSDVGSSILQAIADGTHEEDHDRDSEPNDLSDLISSMSASDVRERNMFLTEILKGRRLTQEQVESIQQSDESRVKLIKLEREKEPREEEQEELQEAGSLTELNNESAVSSKSMNMSMSMNMNMKKRKHNRFMERNKIQASGQLFRECDYLSAEDQQRIQDLVEGAEIYSPFICTQVEELRNRRIDEGIKIHRQMHRGMEDPHSDSEDVINEAALPKDPLLRKEAELKLLREKISSVNSRLRSVEEVVINKSKIRALADRLKEVTKVSKMGESLIQQKQQEMEEESRRLREAEEIIRRAEGQKDEIMEILREMEGKYRDMEREMERIRVMDEEELRKMYQQELEHKRRKVEEVQRDAMGLQEELEGFLSVGQELRQHLQTLDDIIDMRSPEVRCENHRQDETMEDLDELITRKWQAAEQAVTDLQHMH